MIKMSFYDGTLDKEVARKVISESNKPCKYTIGLRMRRPTTLDKPITKQEALTIIDKESWLDITEYDDYFSLNSFSANDMW